MNFFVVNDIDIHKLNFKPFGFFLIFIENPLKKHVVLYLLNNECIINFYFWKKTIILKKKIL
jgi:hypothetical protein